MELRNELDPDRIFLSDYFRERLAVPERRGPARARAETPESADTVRAGSRARPLARWPLLFDLEPVGMSFTTDCSRQMNFAVEAYADPEVVFDAFVELGEAAAWLGHFVARTADENDATWTFEEHFTFMRLRGRTLVYERPHRWIARIDAASIPLASRMLESVELIRQPSGATSLHWRFLFDPHPWTASIEPLVTRHFQAWLRASILRFGRFLEKRSGIDRHGRLDRGG